MKSTSEPLSPEDIKYIKDNAAVQTDIEISKHLNRDIRTIRKHRRKLGILKGNGGVITKATPGQESKIEEVLKVSDRDTKASEFFKEQFKNSMYYKSLVQQFTNDEIDYYLEEWGSLCVQFEDIVATEKRQIDELIKAQIIGNRIMRNIKTTEEEIEKVQQEIDLFREKHDVVTDDEAQERDAQLVFLVRTMSSEADAMVNHYEKNVEIRNKMLIDLNARRKDRIDQLKRVGTTFTGLVQAFRDRAIREAQGRQLELVKLAKNKKSNKWRKINQFPDGSKDCIILDEKSEIPATMKDYAENPISFTIDRFKEETGKRVLIVEDDSARIQFFQDLFGKNTIETASNFHKAMEKLRTNTYDLICLDYDIGLDLKGDMVATAIKENNFSPNANILIHSMNKEGSKAMNEILKDIRNTEVYNFETMLYGYKRKQ